jgi:hypothetical protein
MNMKKTRLMALAATLCAGVAMPASAQPAYSQYDRNPAYGGQYDPNTGPWDRLGSVDFSVRPDHEVAYGNFGGRVEKLAFTARTGSVRCDRITATFNNGRTRELYRGVLPRGREVVVDLPGQSRLIRRIDFDCRSMAPRVARVDIAADIGQYRADWRRSPDWDRVWSRMFNWTDDQFANNVPPRNPPPYTGDRYVQGPPLNTAGWITLGTEVFEGPYDRETTVAGFRGRSVDRIGIRPINADARCSRITATFANGMTRNLNVDDRMVLQEDRVFELDLPGGDRNIERIDMTCHAENGRQVTMLVMANQ